MSTTEQCIPHAPREDSNHHAERDEYDWQCIPHAPREDSNHHAERDEYD